MPLYTYNGDLLVVNNSLAASENCCCDDNDDGDSEGCQDQCQNYVIITIGGEPVPTIIPEIEGQGYTNVTVNRVDEFTYQILGNCCGNLIDLGVVVGRGEGGEGGLGIFSCVCEQQ